MLTIANDTPTLTKSDQDYLARMRITKPTGFTIAAYVFYGLASVSMAALVVLFILSFWFVLPKDLVPMIVAFLIAFNLSGYSAVVEGKACRIIRYLDASDENERGGSPSR